MKRLKSLYNQLAILSRVQTEVLIEMHAEIARLSATKRKGKR